MPKKTIEPTETTCPTEHEEQVIVFKWAEINSELYPQLKLLFAIPNGSYKSKQSARKFAAEGLKSGVPDICLPVPSADGRYHALYIELKRQKGGKVSDQQKEWIGLLQFYGSQAWVCKGAEEAITKIYEYLGMDQEIPF